MQVTGALMLTARFLRTPGGSFRSMWPNIQVGVVRSESKHTWLNGFSSSAARFACQVCKKVFKKVDLLRRHKRIHASHKPVLVCPREDCQAYFSTTFNLQHHIRKVHLNLLKFKCPFPDCPRMFAMRVSKRSIPKRILDSQVHFFYRHSLKLSWFLHNRRAWADICFIMTPMPAFRRFVSHSAAVNTMFVFFVSLKGAKRAVCSQAC